MRTKKSLAIIMLCLIVLSANVLAHETDSFTKTFPAKSFIRMKLIFGDVKIISENTDKIQVSLKYRVDCEEEGLFNPIIEDDKDEIYIEEDFDGDCNGSSSAYWTLIIPEKTNLDLSTASGNYELTGVDGEVDASTASGDVRINKGKGMYHISTASGNIEVFDFSGDIEGSTASGDINARRVNGTISLSTASGNAELDGLDGRIDISSASGDVDARRITVSKESSFSSASGDTYVVLASSPVADLKVSTASGDAVLNFNGNPISGYVELTVDADDGEIECPIKFDNTDEFRRHGKTYLRKSFSIGTNKPEITIGSSSGLARLEK